MTAQSVHNPLNILIFSRFRTLLPSDFYLPKQNVKGIMKRLSPGFTASSWTANQSVVIVCKPRELQQRLCQS
jgi:hypothetical protein